MIGPLPKRPAGSSARQRFMQWVYDTLTGMARPSGATNQEVTATTRGFTIRQPATVTQQGLGAGGPLTAAVWDSTNNVILGVRAGYLVEFSAASGEPTGRYVHFAAPAIGDDSIALMPDGYAVATHWCDPNFNVFAAGGFPPRANDEDFIRSTSKGLYMIDPATCGVVRFFKFTEATSNVSVFTVPIAPFTAVVQRYDEGEAEVVEEPVEEEDQIGDVHFIDLNAVFPPVNTVGLGASDEFFYNGVRCVYYGAWTEPGAISRPATKLVLGPFDVEVGVQMASCSAAGIGLIVVNRVLTGEDLIYRQGDHLGTIGIGETMTIEMAARFEELAGFYEDPSAPWLAFGTLSLSSLSSSATTSWINSSFFGIGPRCVVADNAGFLWVTCFAANGASHDHTWGLNVVDPDTGEVVANENGIGFGSCFYRGLAYDADNDIVVVSTGWGLVRFYYDEGIQWIDDDDIIHPDNFDEDTVGLYGVAIADGVVYCATCTARVITIAYTDWGTETWGEFFLPDLAGDPRVCRYLPISGSLWFACPGTGTVIEVDPDTQDATVYTGFDSPYDVVETEDKVFAVQLGPAGLKLIR